MAEFLAAYQIGRVNEGGYVNDSTDKGGETYAGISRVAYPNWQGWKIVDKYQLKRGEVINDPTLESMIKQFYKAEKWDRVKGDQIDSQGVATFIYDWSLTSGKAVRQIQRELGITDDNVFGGGTLAAINEAGEELLERLYKARDAYFHYLVNKDPSQQKFLSGWLNRNNHLFEILK